MLGTGGLAVGIDEVVVGIDNGGNANKPTVLDAVGTFLIDEIIELPSLVLQGPAVARRRSG